MTHDDTNKRYTLRMDLYLFEHIKQNAEFNRRSIAKEIAFQLEKAYNLKENKC